ncbi:hypothetical protein HYPSUDRAFT_41275 [Hypholoma sublateritium FD-334 SS-4]|uniref:Uncharacterized protein n=1 Tax=Hypholoma sublateritium (strain FD-334 SS-4) TaxID=945553 RepID=A0A0D2L5I7_HYPSF|nr:hypothetical protein HYPSUDRAFT_41275 [Hypholoma sublateritium FD-334 SS-4]
MSQKVSVPQPVSPILKLWNALRLARHTEILIAGGSGVVDRVAVWRTMFTLERALPGPQSRRITPT